MNKYELDKIMECFKLKRANHYEINGCNYYHDGRYFTIVEGKTPYELALLIREKYDNNRYKIRVNGNHESEVPDEDVDMYHIDTTEGLTAFILENQAYYSKNKEYSENFEQFLKLVYSKILQGVNPNRSIYDWMLDRENRKDYFKTVLTMNSYLDFKLRKTIESFDNIINPFCNNNLDLNNQEFIVRGDGAKEDSWFSLVDKESSITMTTIRKKDGFVIKLNVPSELTYETVVYHYFNQNGEEIAFERYDESGLSRIEYNLTDNSFGEHYGTKHQTTTKDKEFIIKNLEEYIALASSIVYKNLGINQPKKIILKKKEN